jgi:hypothetical protein
MSPHREGNLDHYYSSREGVKSFLSTPKSSNVECLLILFQVLCYGWGIIPSYTPNFPILLCKGQRICLTGSPPHSQRTTVNLINRQPKNFGFFNLLIASCFLYGVKRLLLIKSSRISIQKWKGKLCSAGKVAILVNSHRERRLFLTRSGNSDRD